MRVVHTVEGSANIVQRRTDQTRKRHNDWCLTGANDFVVNEKPEGRILEHGGNVTGDAIGSQAWKGTDSRKFAKGFQNVEGPFSVLFPLLLCICREEIP
jgi:hypothetical protein